MKYTMKWTFIQEILIITLTTL